MSTVLIVEDNKNQRQLYVQELEEEGYNVVEAGDGEEAIELVRSGEVKPDIVVLDIHMPKRDGVDTLGALLALNNRLPVIINTAYSSYQGNFMTWSAVAYLVKSSDLTPLKKMIRKTLEEERAAVKA